MKRNDHRNAEQPSVYQVWLLITENSSNANVQFPVILDVYALSAATISQWHVGGMPQLSWTGKADIARMHLITKILLPKVLVATTRFIGICNKLVRSTSRQSKA